MNIESCFSSNYLKAADLGGRTARAVIDTVVVEQVGDHEDKPVLYFRSKTKGLVLNKTNATAIAAAYGSETDRWAGRPLRIYSSKTQYQGRLVDCLRVAVPDGPPAPAAPTRPPDATPAADPSGVEGLGEPGEDEIPF